MSKFNSSTVHAVGTGPISSEPTASGRTHEGAPGYARDVKSELFLLAVTNMVGEKTFYESAAGRDSRFITLVRQIAVTDFDWLCSFAVWLRGVANMRSASLVLAAEAAKARLDAGLTGSRPLVASVLQRADEPGEFIAYWQSRYGRALPKPVKRGVADAAAKLYTERNVLKYDTDSHGVRFADVIQLAHVQPRADWQNALFTYVIGKRLRVDGLAIPGELLMIAANWMLTCKWTVEDIDRAAADGTLAAFIADAGVTWEALSSFGAWTAKRWEAVIPSMGYMALLRNLRNFDQAGVSDKVAAHVVAKLIDPEEVARSRQLPMRFLSAFNAAPSLRWAWPLEQALDSSISTIPALTGSTLILVDTSTSMNESFSKDGSLHRWDAAAMFGIALGRRCAHADVVSYSSAQMYWNDPVGARTKVFAMRQGESLLKALQRWKSDGYFLGGGTDTAGAMRKHYGKHDRVVLLTDEQAGHNVRDVTSSVPAAVPLYTWNLAGYQHGHAPDGPNRYTFGGLTDASFGMIELLERGRNADWPWKSTTVSV